MSPSGGSGATGTLPVRRFTTIGDMTRLRVQAKDLVDILVYLLVLGTFTQLFPAVISESFLASVVTAVLLKLMLELVVWVKGRIFTAVREAKSRPARVAAILTVPVFGAVSKAFVLWGTDVVLGDAVHLGGFWSVTLLVIVLMLARAGVRRVIS